MEEQPHVVEVETVEPARPRGRRDWFGIIVSISALATSVASIFVAVQNSNSMDRLVQANSWPYLQFLTGNQREDGRQVVSVSLSNTGVGPLKLETFVVSHNDEDFGDGLEMMLGCCLPPDTKIEGRVDFESKIDRLGTSKPTGAVISPGAEVLVFSLPKEGAVPEAYEALNAARFTMNYRACYCSVFDECWETNFKTTHPTPVAACKPEPNSWNG